MGDASPRSVGAPCSHSARRHPALCILHPSNKHTYLSSFWIQIVERKYSLLSHNPHKTPISEMSDKLRYEWQNGMLLNWTSCIS
jgi:hypothetical protein